MPPTLVFPDWGKGCRAAGRGIIPFTSMITWGSFQAGDQYEHFTITPSQEIEIRETFEACLAERISWLKEHGHKVSKRNREQLLAEAEGIQRAVLDQSSYYSSCRMRAQLGRAMAMLSDRGRHMHRSVFPRSMSVPEAQEQEEDGDDGEEGDDEDDEEEMEDEGSDEEDEEESDGDMGGTSNATKKKKKNNNKTKGAGRAAKKDKDETKESTSEQVRM